MKQRISKLFFGAGILTVLPFVLLTLCAVILLLIGLGGRIRSAGYKTGVTDEGRLRFAYRFVQGERTLCTGYDREILGEEKEYLAGSKEIVEFTPLRAGSTDMAVCGHEGFRDESVYELYHITVDEELKISYTAEELSREEFNRIWDEYENNNIKEQ